MSIAIPEGESFEQTKERLEEAFGESMMHAIRNYIEHGLEPGSFLTAIICNDLREAIGRADWRNQKLINEYVFYFYNYLPGSCWGSYERMEKWLESKQSNEATT